MNQQGPSQQLYKRDNLQNVSNEVGKYYNKFSGNNENKTTNLNYNITHNDNLISNNYQVNLINLNNYGFYYGQPTQQDLQKWNRLEKNRDSMNESLNTANTSTVSSSSRIPQSMFSSFASTSNASKGSLHTNEPNRKIHKPPQNQVGQSGTLKNFNNQFVQPLRSVAKNSSNSCTYNKTSFKNNPAFSANLHEPNYKIKSSNINPRNFDGNNNNHKNLSNYRSDNLQVRKKNNQNFLSQNNLKKLMNNGHAKRKISFSLQNQQFKYDNSVLQIYIKIKEETKVIKLKRHEDIYLCAKNFCAQNNIPEPLIRPISNKIHTTIHSVNRIFNTHLTDQNKHFLKEIESVYNRETKDSSFLSDSASSDSDSHESEELNVSSISQFSCESENEDDLSIMRRSF